MTNVAVFLVGVGATALASFCAVAYLTPSLRKILIELCGTAERADFWLAFSNLSLMVTPLIFALRQFPEYGPQTSVVFQLGSQIEWALIGLVATVFGVGFVIGRFIPRPRSMSAAIPAGPVAAKSRQNTE